MLELGVVTCVLRHLGHEQLVADVHVGAVALAGREHDRVTSQRERDRQVTEPPPVAICDDCALVADHRIAQARGLERAAHRLEHAPGDDDDVQTGVVRTAQRRDRARLQDAVLPDERPVEVGRDDADVVRERCGKLQAQPFGLPPDALTT